MFYAHVSLFVWSLILDLYFTRAKFISAEETTGVTFDDFAGQEYIKRELQEIVRILKNEEEFQNKGIYCPKGVLLHGPPGTGKTLLAKAIAGEAGLPFFAANGTDFVEVRSNFSCGFFDIMKDTRIMMMMKQIAS